MSEPNGSSGPRVLLASCIVPRRSSGMGRWTYEVLEGLRRRGLDVRAWWETDLPGGARLQQAGVLLVPLLLAGKLIRHRRDFDVAIIHEPIAAWCVTARRLAPSLIPRVVVMCHNVESKAFERVRAASARGLAAPALVRPLRWWAGRGWQSVLAIRLADRVLCLSTEDRDFMVDRVGVSRDRVFVVPNGVDPARFAPPPGPRAGGQRVLFVGGWIDVKGRRLLARIWSEVVRVNPRATLTIAGAGVETAAILADFAEPERQRVQVVSGSLDEQAMSELYGGHDVLLVTSITEGAPLAVLEAMASGLAVVAARTGGLPDMIRDGTDGVLYEPLDVGAGAAALCKVLKDLDLARALGRAARTRATASTWDRSAAAIAAAIGVSSCRPPLEAIGT